MRIIISFLGVLIAAGFWVLSVRINYSTGFDLGNTPNQKEIFSYGAVLGDFIKTLLPFFMAWAWVQKRHAVFILSSFGLVGCILLSVYSAFNFGYKARIQNTGEQLAINEKMQIWKSQRQRARQKLQNFAGTKPSSTLASELLGLRQDRRWDATKNCTDATAKKSRSFCKQYFALDGSQKNAVRMESLEFEISELNKKIAANTGKNGALGDDPAAKMLSGLIGTTPEKFKTFVVVIFGFIMELFSGLGFFMALGHGGFDQKRQQKQLTKERTAEQKRIKQKQKTRQDQAGRGVTGLVATGRGWSGLTALLSPKRAGRARQFAIECVDYQKDANMPLSELYEGYETWCKDQNQRFVSKNSFEKNVRPFLDENNWQVIDRHGEPCWQHMALKKTQKTQLKAVA